MSTVERLAPDGERVVLVWDGLSAHWSRAIRAWVAEQDWLSSH